MTKILMTKTIKRHRAKLLLYVLNFEHLNFDIVSACPGATYPQEAVAPVDQVWARDFDIRYSDFDSRYDAPATC